MLQDAEAGWGKVYGPEAPWHFEAKLRFLPAEEGGRLTPVYLGYRPDLYFPSYPEPGQWIIWPVCFFAETREPLPPGTRIAGEVHARFRASSLGLWESLHRERIKPNLPFEVREGHRTIAHGKVTRVADRDDWPPN